MSIVEQLNTINKLYPIYHARRTEFAKPDVPFIISNEPLQLNAEQQESVSNLGPDIISYLHSIEELYEGDERVRHLLDRGKPQVYLMNEKPHYLFVRPDLIITPNGFSICEIETSPFGLALADMLNRTYRSEGHNTMADDESLSRYVQSQTRGGGSIVHTDKTASYRGQMSYLADRVFQRGWKSFHIDEYPQNQDPTYRGFYLSEFLNDPKVKEFIEAIDRSSESGILPSLTPQFEEKALLAFIWDRRFEDHIRRQIGNAAFNHLRKMIPPNWIVGEEQYFSPGMPGGVTSALDLAGLSRSKRTFVLKPSGFTRDSSWAEGVHFLHTLSQERAASHLSTAVNDTSCLHVVQAFERPSSNNFVQYSDTDGTHSMAGRVRITPYYGIHSTHMGMLLGIKATIVENTDKIHAGSHSINTAVA